METLTDTLDVLRAMLCGLVLDTDWRAIATMTQDPDGTDQARQQLEAADELIRKATDTIRGVISFELPAPPPRPPPSVN